MELIQQLKDMTLAVTERTTAALAVILKGRERIKQLEAAKVETTCLPLPAGEVIETRIPQLVAGRRAAFLARHASAFTYGPYSLCKPDLKRAANAHLPEAIATVVDVLSVCDPTLAEAYLAGILRSASYKAGPPSAERPSLLGAIERELEHLKAVDEHVTDEAIAAGLNIELRPDVLARREADARQHAIDAEQRRQVQAQQQRVNESYTGRAARSPYIEEESRREV